jgi:hypothetical protein
MPSSSVPDSTAAAKPARHARATQAERRTRTREALPESAARGVSRHGYGNLVLEQVARDVASHVARRITCSTAGTTSRSPPWTGSRRPRTEVAEAVEEEPDPPRRLMTLARRRAVSCRRDIARMARCRAARDASISAPPTRYRNGRTAQLFTDARPATAFA